MQRLDLPSATRREPASPARERAMFAHDMRGALAGLIGGLALLDRSRIDPALHPQMDRIDAAAEALSLLMRHVEGDPVPPGEEAPEAAPETVRLPALLGYVLRRWTGEAEERGLALRAVTEDAAPKAIVAGWTDCCRIVSNLVSNAVKFGERGVVTVAVRGTPDGGAVVAVEDEGPGLNGCDPSQFIEFGFRREDAATQGSGIGLSIARELAARIGARLELADRLGGGLSARLHVPPALCRAAPEPEPEPERPLPDLGGRRVLIAEDNPTNQMVASQMFEAMGAEVVVAGDGLEALAHFEKERFDLVVIDIEMPRMSGLDVIRSIRARHDARARTPVVALTAYAMKEHRLTIAEAGADGLISKPIVCAAEFGAAVAQHLLHRPPVGDERAPDAEPVIDRAVFDALAGTIGPEMMAELLDRIVADLEAARTALAAARAPLDPTGIRTTSHILISVAGAFGAARLRARASLLNRASHAPEAAELGEKVRACLDEIGAAVEFVREQRTRC